MQPSLTGVVLALDIDGVLLDATRAGKGRWSNELAVRFGVDGKELQAAFFRPYWSEVIVGTRPIEPALAAALLELQWDLGVEEVLACWFEADCVVDHDVVDAARQWAEQGATIVLATNQEHRRVAHLRTRLEPLLPFDTILYSGALGAQKRHPAFFKAATTALGPRLDTTRVVFVDDDRANVEAAVAHGWVGIQFTKHDRWREEIDIALHNAASDQA